MMVEYVSIAEFAKMAKISPQSIYKRLKKVDNPLQPFIKLVDNHTMISTEALSLYQNPEPKQEPPAEEVIEPKAPADDMTAKLIEMLQKELEEKSEQLKVKDKQISELNERLAESQQMLNQQQHLNAIAEQKLLALESKAEEEPAPKKRWWQRI